MTELDDILHPEKLKRWISEFQSFSTNQQLRTLCVMREYAKEPLFWALYRYDQTKDLMKEYIKEYPNLVNIRNSHGTNLLIDLPFGI